MFSKKVQLALTCFTFLFVLFSQVPRAEAESMFWYSENGAPTNLDPAQTTTVYSSLVLRTIYDTLYEYKYLTRPYVIKPNLAEALPVISKDGLTYTIKIKKGVHYADDPAFKNGKGREVTAEDFVYSIKRHFDPKNRPQNAWLWQGKILGLDEWKKAGSDYTKKVPGLFAKDRYTIVIKLTKRFPQLIYTLAMTPASFLPKEAVDKYKREISIHPVGSGPYILKSFHTKKAVLVRNPKFRKIKLDLKAEGYDEKIHGYTGIKALDGKTLPIMDRIDISFMKEAASRWASFKKGTEIQFTSVPIEHLKNVTTSVHPVILNSEHEKNFHKKVNLEFGYVYSNFNMSDPEFGYNPDKAREKRNHALRCAIRKGFNWKQRVTRFYYGIGEAFPGVVPPGVDGHDPSFSKNSIELDVEGAKKLLAANGWNAGNLPVIQYGGVSSVRSLQFFEQFRGWMIKIGYPRKKVKFQSFATFGDYSKAMKESKVGFHGLGWSIDYPDAENILQLYYGPNESPGSNTSNFKNPEYDRLYRKAATMQPSPARSNIYKRMNQILVDECVTVSGFSRSGVYLWPKKVLMYPDRDVLGGYFLKYVGMK